MPKRNPRDALDGRLNSVARDAFLLDIQASGGDIGRVSLAVSRWRAAEITKEAPTRKSGMVRFFESTLIGKPVAVLVENIEASIAEHGPILGTARGLLIGIMVAAALVVATEGLTFGFNIARYWIDLHWGVPLETHFRGTLIEAESKKASDKFCTDPAHSKSRDCIELRQQEQTQPTPPSNALPSNRQSPATAPPSAAAPADPPKPSQQLTLSQDVPYFQITATDYLSVLTNGPVQSSLIEQTQFFKDYTVNPAVRKLGQGTLRQGTRYTPKRTTDGKLFTIPGRDGKDYIVVEFLSQQDQPRYAVIPYQKDVENPTAASGAR